jgi:large subunit ribosomal protein L13
MRQTHKIDATGKVLGRLASQIAVLLMGKNKLNYDPSKDMGDFVIVKNVEKMKISGKKLEKEKHYRYSGYLGGLKEVPLKKIFKENPSQILKKAVYGMLPKNRLRKRMIKRLKFE